MKPATTAKVTPGEALTLTCEFAFEDAEKVFWYNGETKSPDETDPKACEGLNQ